MSNDDLQGLDCSSWIAVLPLGAHEQHGPHLPLETDTTIAAGISRRLASTIDAAIPVTFLPAEPVGYSIEHMDFSGSRSLGYAEAVDRWIGIGEELAEYGIRKLVLLNAHGGNSPLMSVVATELRVRSEMLCVATSWTRFIEAGRDLSEAEKAFGIHGGELETSVMLALDPSSVKMDKVKDFPSYQEELAEKFRFLRAYGPHAFGWKMGDLNVEGVVGNAAAATLEKGEALLSRAVDGLSGLIHDVHDFDLSNLKG